MHLMRWLANLGIVAILMDTEQQRTVLRQQGGTGFGVARELLIPRGGSTTCCRVRMRHNIQ